MQPLFVYFRHEDFSFLAVLKDDLWRPLAWLICQLLVFDRNVWRLGVLDHLLHCCNFDVDICVDCDNFFTLGFSFTQLLIFLTDDVFI